MVYGIFVNISLPTVDQILKVHHNPETYPLAPERYQIAFKLSSVSAFKRRVATIRLPFLGRNPSINATGPPVGRIINPKL